MSRISIYEQWEKEGILQEKLIEIEGMARDGLVQQQIADNLAISIDTLIRYKKSYNAFCEALKRGKEVVDRQVENALLMKALGFKETVSKVKVLQNGELVHYEEEVFHPPDTTAQIFWLKNRKPIEWRDKQNIEHSGKVEANNPFEALTTEELKKLIQLDE